MHVLSHPSVVPPAGIFAVKPVCTLQQCAALHSWPRIARLTFPSLLAADPYRIVL